MDKERAKPRLPMTAVESLELAKQTMAGKNLKGDVERETGSDQLIGDDL